jgi:hypothetical protein
MYLASKRTAVVEIPKCASTSLSDVFCSSFDVSGARQHLTLKQHQQKNPELNLGVALIREPLDRLHSAVEFCIARRGVGGVSAARSELDRSIRAGRPSQTSVVLYPQYSFLLCDVPARLYRLSSIGLLLGGLGVDTPPPKSNKTKRSLRLDQVIAVFGEDFVRRFYALDFAIYNSLCSTQDGFLEVRSVKDYIFSLREGTI